MTDDDWEVLFGGTEWDNLDDLLNFPFYGIMPLEQEIKDLIEIAYKMGKEASNLTKNEAKRSEEGNAQENKLTQGRAI